MYVRGDVWFGDHQVEDLKTTVAKPLNAGHYVFLYSANDGQKPEI